MKPFIAILFSALLAANASGAARARESVGAEEKQTVGQMWGGTEKATPRVLRKDAPPKGQEAAPEQTAKEKSGVGAAEGGEGKRSEPSGGAEKEKEQGAKAPDASEENPAVKPPPPAPKRKPITPPPRADIYINGILQPPDFPAYFVKDRVFVPMEGFFERLGIKVDWWPWLHDDSIDLGAYLDSLELPQISGKTTAATPRPIVINGMKMIPVRFVSEAIGMDCRWDKKRWAVHLVY